MTQLKQAVNTVAAVRGMKTPELAAALKKTPANFRMILSNDNPRLDFIKGVADAVDMSIAFVDEETGNIHKL